MKSKMRLSSSFWHKITMRCFPFFSFHEILVKNLFIVVHLITFHIFHCYIITSNANEWILKEFYLKAFFLSSIIIPQRLNNNCTRYYQSYVIILSSIINNTARNLRHTRCKKDILISSIIVTPLFKSVLAIDFIRSKCKFTTFATEKRMPKKDTTLDNN